MVSGTMVPCKKESAHELVSSLREFFTNYGVPEELATDGGSNYMSRETQDFLITWGVKHRVSSAYHPPPIFELKRRSRQ